ncbi:TPA: hypothetical protein LNT98_000511 [Salmonella enterica subsp. enterica serovar Typhimurium]|nr:MULTISPECIES: hypothetical protein [Salmonella]EDQ9773305.1 hypothetical protein [Salmonella enterica subsp. salamae]EDT7498552.1 hypothetical protein [Salmonella enterica subsp. enterica serovar Schleissheim]EHB3479674.1 hypothetical protein [Salmonella enterica subsp. enterica serovar Newport]MCL8916684.1 hypothetical protein [Salmonella enterica subsp. enterica serovar Enteritidis]SUG67701.1 Uncharacterised protein [Salmonella enterica subsp. enterica]HAS9093194.1 hypothetical protein [
MSEQNAVTFKSDSHVIIAADAAIAAINEALKDATDDFWLRQKMIRAALEAALSATIVL